VLRIVIQNAQHTEYALCDDGPGLRASGKHLRRVAKACEAMGQRLQKSVFECQVNDMQFEQLERTLLAEIDEKQDNLRFYRITEPVEVRVKPFGKFRSVDFEGPLLV
jgi:CRISPR-associated protein Cas2